MQYALSFTPFTWASVNDTLSLYTVHSLKRKYRVLLAKPKHGNGIGFPIKHCAIIPRITPIETAYSIAAREYLLKSTETTCEENAEDGFGFSQSFSHCVFNLPFK